VEKDPLTERVIGCAIEVHRALGPGLLESIYQQCLAHEFDLQAILYQRELPMPVRYKGLEMDTGFRLDFLVEERLILELKAVREVRDIDRAQILT
jgi:GxxExxY protein